MLKPANHKTPKGIAPWDSGPGSWLPDMDLNHDKQIQSLLCYRYTIGQPGAPMTVGNPR